VLCLTFIPLFEKAALHFSSWENMNLDLVELGN